MNIPLISRFKAARLVRSGDIPVPGTSRRQECRRYLLATALLVISVIPAARAAFAVPFTPGNLVIYRVGNGTGSLLNTGAPVFLDEYSPTGTLVQSVPMPTSAFVGSFSLIASGTATSEGEITRSLDGRYLALTGYNSTIPFSSSLASSPSSSVYRTIGRVDWNGNVNTTTVLQDFAYGNNPRSAFTTDGTSFWGAGGAGGVRYAPLGTNTTSTQVSSGIPTLTNLRQINVFNGQLYASSGSGTTVRLGTVGTGLSTSAGQGITNLPGFPTTGSPYAFFFADLTPSVSGVDTLYVADDLAGLQKFSLVAGSWTANGTIGTDADDYRGLTATVNGTSVNLFATIKGGSLAVGGGQLVKLTDTSGYNATITGTPTVLATAAANTAFRGVALAPYFLPDLTVEVSAPATATVGVPFTYTITARNIGNKSASDIDMDFYPPSGLVVSSVTGTSGFDGFDLDPFVYFYGGTLEPGASATLTVTVTAATAGNYSTIPDAAFVDLSETITESDETNNSSGPLVSTVVSNPTQNYINLDLLGKGGAGLLSQNENGVISGTPGTGGEVGAGCRYETNSRVLSINVAWGSQNGFTDLSSSANNSHIHGPTASAGAASFLQNAGVLFNLPRVSSTANGGSINTTVTLSAAQEADLLAGKYYINIHTATNGGGEIRGNLVVPANLPTITTQPVSQTINSGTTATLTVAASGSPAPSFQWYRGNSGDTSNPVGTNSATFTTPTLTATTSYWVQATNTSGSPANSQTATVTVLPPPAPEILIEEPQGMELASGATRDFGGVLVGAAGVEKTFVVRNTGNAPLSITASGLIPPGPAEFSIAGVNLPASVAAGQSAMLRIVFNPATGGLRNGLFRILSNDADEGIFTISFSGTGFTPPLFTSQPTASQTIIYNAGVVLESLASGFPAPTYQWYRGLSGNISVPVVGATSPALNTSALTASTSFWVRATNAHGFADSQTAYVEVEPISTNALLANLIPSAGQLSPSFASASAFYTLLVPSGVSELALTPFKAHPAASIKINGAPVASGSASQVIPIAFGENPINVVVTAQDGETIRSYLLNATRAQPMFVITGNASGVTRTAATLNGTVIPNGTATVRFEYGTSTSYGFSTPPQQASGTNLVDIQAAIANLLPGTRYHFRMVATNGVDSVVGANQFFDTQPGEPLVITGNPVNVTTASARLVGAVDGRGQNVTVWFEYGTDFPPTTLSSEQVIPAAGGYTNVIADVTGLTPNALHSVRLVARVGTGLPTYGGYKTFTATAGGSGNGAPTAVPIVTTGDVVSITTNAAEVRGTVNAKGGTTAVWIEYGPTPALGLRSERIQEIGNLEVSADVSIPISGLVSGTEYYYKVVAQNGLGIGYGNSGMFSTGFLAPSVSTNGVSVLSTTSVRVFGTVRANRSVATVRFRYGTSPDILNLIHDGAPASVSGDVNTTVSADLADLRQGTRYYYQAEAVNGGGESGGSVRSFDVAVLSGLDRRFPDLIDSASHQGVLQVNLTPPSTGGWRFAGEIGWRAAGSSASGLASGDRRIEYRPAPGFLTPVTETLTVNATAGPQTITRNYFATSTPGSGRLRVSLKPDSVAALSNMTLNRAQWRLAGESDVAWRDTDAEIAGLVPGSYFIESKPVAGFEIPAPVGVAVADGQTTLATVTYYLAADTVGTAGVPVPFSTVAGDSSQPFGYVGQILSDAGASTGFVVKPRVVATAGHVVFDDGTLAAATNLNWLFQQDAGVHEPVPAPPRGFYLMSGYAAQRALDGTPGVSSPASQNLDAAALYFADSAICRNGYSGYLASDLSENEFLLSDREKILAGYPVEGVAAEMIGRMHATPSADVDFSQAYLRTYLSTGIRGSGGMSGGPLFVREPSGIWYPAAIYLGGTRQAIVRAIDSDVADLFGFAETSAELVEGGTGGSGVIGATSPLPTPDLGGIRVIIQPAAARNVGAGWRINSGDPYRQSSAQIVNLSPNTYTVRFSSVPGFLPPAPQTITVASGQLSTLTFTYEEQILPPVITSPSSVTLVRGQNLSYQITTQPAAQSYTLFGPLPPGVEFNATQGRITGIPQTAGVFVLQAGATNLGGSGSKTVTLTSLPVIAEQSVSAIKGAPINHPLVSGEAGAGISWSSSPLPEGLSLDPDSGVVSGTPEVAGVFTSNISITRNGATASAQATFTITGEAPAFTLEPPTTREIEFGTSTTFVVSATGEPAPTYQWYRGASGNIANPVVGATSPTFVTPVLVEPASFWVRATSFGRIVDSRAVSITLLASANAELASLETDAGVPSPVFNPTVVSYRITLPNTTSSVRLLPSARVSQTAILVNGQSVVSGSASDPIVVPVGTSRINVNTTAGNGVATRLYTLDVTRLPAASAATDPATSITDSSVRLNGRVTPNGLGEAFFEYGLTTAYGSRTRRQAVSGDQPIALPSDLSGLEPLSTYHFRMVLETGGAVVNGMDREFTTNRRPPTVATGAVFRSTTADATLTGAVNPNGQNVTLFFEYGLSQQLGGRTASFTPSPNGGSAAVDVSQILTGLQANNQYFYRLVAVDESNTEWPGRIETFTAIASTGNADGIADSPPSVVTGAATDLTTTSATLAGQATPNDGSTEVWFEYGPVGQPYNASTPFQLIGNGGEPRDATARISGLVTESDYRFRMMARNSRGTTPGLEVIFRTRFNPPVVTISTVEALSPTSVRITGTVDPKGTTTEVDFRYGPPGTNFQSGATASEGDQTGSGARPVSVILTALEPSQLFETLIEATSDGGTVQSSSLRFQPGALLGLVQQFPEPIGANERSGQVLVNILPSGIGAWRFSGETKWRSSGIPATGLTTGNRIIEFRPEIGFNRPLSESVSVISGSTPQILEALYYPSPEPGLAAITVNLEPLSVSEASVPLASRAQWRFAGVAADPWKDSGTTVSQLPEGSHLIECKPIPGRQTPLPRSVMLSNDLNRAITFTYFAATAPLLNPPGPVSFETAISNTLLASGYVGQVRGDLGTSSGFAVKRRVVATAAQTVFDESLLTLTGNLEWLWLPDRGNHDPKPIAARGVYVFDGYAAQRSTEATSGTLSSISQNLNVAAIYFAEDAARGGASGFLSSDETANPHLVSNLDKMLAGYPSVGVSPTNLGRLHVTNPSSASFAHLIGRTFDSAAIRGFGGMAGGPLSVKTEGGAYYPAGIYVGGTTRGIVRAIDTPIIDLFSRAEVSGNGGDNDTGGGITHTAFANFTSSTTKGAVTVTIRPSAAIAAFAGWRLSTIQSYKDSGAQIGNLSPGTYSLLMSSISGYPSPPVANISVVSGKTTEVVFDYSAINTEPTISELANVTVSEDSSTGLIGFSIGDLETSVSSLSLTRSSSNTALVPNTSIVLSGSGASRTVFVTPAANQSGTATITITASDGSLSASRSFILTVNPVNDPPVISVIGNQNVAVGNPLSPVPFTVSDLETSSSLLGITTTSTNAALVPSSAITLSGSGSNRSISILPVAGQLGSTTITVSVSDESATISRNFILTVDGTPFDTWRFANFGTSSNTGGAANDVDADGDGKLNIEEYSSGTDPNNPSDFFRVLSAARIGTTFRVTVSGRAHRNYVLERSNSLASPVWIPVATSGLLDAPDILQLSDNISPQGAAYYRVSVSAN